MNHININEIHVHVCISLYSIRNEEIIKKRVHFQVLQKPSTNFTLG